MSEASCARAGDEVELEADEKIADTGSADVNSTRPPTTVTAEPSAARRRRGRREVLAAVTVVPSRVAASSRDAPLDGATSAVTGDASSDASPKPFVIECPCVDFMGTIIEN